MTGLLAAMGFRRPKGSPDARSQRMMLPGGGLMAIHEPTFHALLEQWQAWGSAPMAAFPGSTGAQAVPMKQGNVAIVEMSGPMSRGGTPCFGAGSTLDFRAALRACERDADVTDIVAIIDSPGGTVAGTGDAGDEIARVAKVKPVYVYIPDMAASAGFWLAAQGTQVWSSPNATTIGNINARRTLINVYESLKRAGIDVTILKGSRGTFKDAGDGSKPFTEAELAYLQAEVDRFELAFATAIARGRNITMDKALEWSDGRWFDAPTALSMGLIDRVGTLDDLLATILKAPDPKSFDEPNPGPDNDDDEGQPDVVARTPAGDPLRVAAGAIATLMSAKASGEPASASEARALALPPPTPSEPDGDRDARSKLTPEQEDALAKPGFYRFSPNPEGADGTATVTYSATPPVSAPGGQPGPPGSQTAPNAGAEKTPIVGKSNMSETTLKPGGYLEPGAVTKLHLQAALNNAGLQEVANMLGQSEAMDAHGIAHALARGITTQVNAGIGRDDRLIALDSVGARGAKDVYRLGNDAKVGKEARDLAMERCEKAYIHVNGTEGLGHARMQWEDKTYAGLVAKAEALESDSDAKNRNSKTEAARRVSVPNGSVATALDVENVAQRPWERLTADQQAEAEALPHIGKDRAKQDAFALNLLGEDA